MKVLLSIPDDLLGKLDTYCKTYNYERSELIRALIRDKVSIYPKDISQTIQPDTNSNNSNKEPTRIVTKPSISELRQTITEIQQPSIFGSFKLRCQVCQQAPAISREYNFEDGSGIGQGIFCQKHNDRLDKKTYTILAPFVNIPTKVFMPNTGISISKPIKKEKKGK